MTQALARYCAIGLESGSTGYLFRHLGGILLPIWISCSNREKVEAAGLGQRDGGFLRPECASR